jgi:type VI protein secretion system component Hcp
VTGGNHEQYTWANSCYAMATNIARSFKLYGWCTSIRGVESGGAVEGLPTHTFSTDDGGVDSKCPTEIAISDRREGELAKAGLMPLVHRKNTDFAAFIGAQSVHQPAEYDDPAASANANLGACLPYIFGTSRFAHYLKCIVRDKVGRPGMVTLTKKFDSSSPTLAKACANGKHFDKATLVMAKSGEGQQTFMTITFKEVRIADFNVSAAQGGEVHESVAVSYGDIEIAYKPQKADGTMGGDIKFGWDTRSTETR